MLIPFLTGLYVLSHQLVPKIRRKTFLKSYHPHLICGYILHTLKQTLRIQQSNLHTLLLIGYPALGLRTPPIFAFASVSDRTLLAMPRKCTSRGLRTLESGLNYSPPNVSLSNKIKDPIDTHLLSRLPQHQLSFFINLIYSFSKTGASLP